MGEDRGKRKPKDGLLSTAQLVEKLASAKQFKLDKRQLAKAVLEEFGGYRGIAAMLREQWEAAPPGSMARATLTRAALGALSEGAALDEGKPDMAWSLSEEQLGSVIEHFVAQNHIGEDEAESVHSE